MDIARFKPGMKRQLDENLTFCGPKKKNKYQSLLRVGGPESSVLSLVRAQSKKHHIGIINTHIIYEEKIKNSSLLK